MAGLYSLKAAGGGGDGSIGGRSWPGPAIVAGSARAEQRSGGRVHQEVKAIIYRYKLLAFYVTLISIENGQTPHRHQEKKGLRLYFQ